MSKPARAPLPFSITPRTYGIFGISLLSGFLAYGFNLLIDAYYGPATLARVLAALGAAATIGLPASLVSLPVATWAGQEGRWRRQLPWVQGGFLLAGLLSALGVLLLRGDFPLGWLMPLGLLIALSSYLPAVSTGALVGRAAFVASAVLMMLPNLGRFVGLLIVGHRADGVLTVLWVQALSFAAVGAFGLWLPYRTSRPEAIRPVKATPWASGWVALAVTAWLSVDVFVATLHLGAARAAGFAVLALLGKAPYYLAQPVVLMAIGEEGWGVGRRRMGSFAILAVSLVSVIGALAIGGSVLHLMGVQEPGWLLGAYFLGTCALSLSYLWSGSDAQRSIHHWWPVLAACGLWVAWALGLGGGTTSLVVGYAMAQLLGAAATVGLGAWRGQARGGDSREAPGAVAN